ncbi:cytosine deaminase [Terrarubrum flagellatum]|uniref:cytosine deaminase n=1 Tax=Terrirubrum flagellatum TaxID=2895980 RepID=UPI0031453CC6
MAFDLLIRGATLADGRVGIDLAIKDGRFVEIAPAIQGEARETIDATGRFVSPPFVDAHFHLDATLALGFQGRFNVSGTLAEGIAIWNDIRDAIPAEDFRRRALAYCDLAVSQGLLAIRSHVDVTDKRLVAVDVLLDVKKEVAPYLDLQLVAFPQMGYFSAPETPDNIARALDKGVEVVGGIPHLEPTAELGHESVRRLARLAADRGLMIDLHCDENDDPNSRCVETLAYETKRLGLGGRAVGSHLTSMHSMDNFYAARLITMMAKADLQVVTNPLANMFLQGRFDSYPKRRGLARIPELMAAGCTVATGHDSVLDPWYPLGRADMLDVASMTVHAAHLSSHRGMRDCLDLVTTLPAKILGLGDYGIEIGKPADCVVLQAADGFEAIRLRPPRLAVVRRGNVIARSEPTQSALMLPGRPTSVDPAVIRAFSVS